ncbi:hypothetical protein [Streptomyces sp. NBC_01217]|uniref:hypothetical protein n=1 Tax=Streptomyces sp. NBC_01217 TaxID=2903779 RepID=UPI002E155C40|nr:hypothetical protein OG507_20795 [Streptomyces sp. NBC_01217]
MTIAAVLLGALTTHLTNYAMERNRNRQALLTRWDGSKLSAYENYVDTVRACIFLAVELYEVKNDLRTSTKTEAELLLELGQAGRERGRAFERVMLLGGDDVVEAAHQLASAGAQVDWQAKGTAEGTLDDWRERNRVVFREINEFHEQARVDLGVQGSVKGEKHPERDLLLPPQSRDNDSAGA